MDVDWRQRHLGNGVNRYGQRFGNALDGSSVGRAAADGDLASLPARTETTRRKQGCSGGLPYKPGADKFDNDFGRAFLTFMEKSMSFFDKLLSSMGGGHHGNRGGHGGNKHGYQGDPYGYPAQPTPPANTGISCPACSATNLPNARFCAQCGKSMPPASCDACKSPLVAGAKFCANCGKSQA